MKPCVFIHTNEKQIIGALVSKYSFERFASDPSSFEVKLVETGTYDYLKSHEGRLYLRDGLKRSWLYNDLQSFTVLRFTPPELMGYQGRSLVVDPDVFCISDINQLLTARHAGQGHHGAPPRGLQGRGLGLERDAARQCRSSPTGRWRRTSRRCSASSATT